MLSLVDFEAITLTLQVAGVTTAVLVFIGIPLAWWLSQTQTRWRVFLEAGIALPLVLPPTVLGFYLLLAMNPNGKLTQMLRLLGWEGQLSFSFSGLVLGSCLYSLPFAVQPLQSSFEKIPRTLLDVAATLRAHPWDIFWRIVAPLSKRGILTATLMTFMHTVGEFGVVLMVGGNIPGKTRMVSIAIFDHVESMEYREAHAFSAAMLALAFGVLISVYSLNRRWDRTRER